LNLAPVPSPGTVCSADYHSALARCFVASAILVAALTFASAAKAQQPQQSAPPPQTPPEEYQVKADYLANFSRFVDWPGSQNSATSPAADNTPNPSVAASARPEDPFVICIIGRDPFGPTLDNALVGQTVDARKIIARRISAHKDTLNCEILFIAASEATHAKEILSRVEKYPVLTVSDLPTFLADGGMIQFIVREEKIRFAVNVSVAQKAGLAVSSQLLKVAAEIKKDPTEETNP
jgi:hypothetical protein